MTPRLLVLPLVALALVAHAEPPAPKKVPPYVMQPQQLQHPLPQLPSWFAAQHDGQLVSGTYQVCVGTDGHVETAKPVRPIGDSVDAEIAQTIFDGWTYQPQREPVCFDAVLIFRATKPAPAPPPPPGAGPKMVAAFTLSGQQVTHAQPLLPEKFRQDHPHQRWNAMYKVCVGSDGAVTSVKPMTPIGDARVDQSLMEQIRAGWTYKPQPEPVCFAAALRFQND